MYTDSWVYSHYPHQLFKEPKTTRPEACRSFTAVLLTVVHGVVTPDECIGVLDGGHIVIGLGDTSSQISSGMTAPGGHMSGSCSQAQCMIFITRLRGNLRLSFPPADKPFQTFSTPAFQTPSSLTAPGGLSKFSSLWREMDSSVDRT